MGTEEGWGALAAGLGGAVGVDDGFAFSLSVSCDDSAVSDGSWGSMGSEEGSGAKKRGEGGRARGCGGGI